MNNTNISGKITKYGTKRTVNSTNNITILLTNVINLDTNEEVRDHIWVNMTRGLNYILKDSLGKTIQFTARIDKYVDKNCIEKKNLRHIRNVLIKN